MWRGPYTQFKRYIGMGDLNTLRPELIYVGDASHLGPIVPAEPLPRGASMYDTNDKYPLDPWGNPYIFEVLPNSQGGRIYSLGPDGMPGTVAPSQTTDPNYVNGLYFHTYNAVTSPNGKLGITGQMGDDLVQDF